MGVNLAIRAVLLMVLYSHTVSGQLYVLATVPQGKGPQVPPGQEAFCSYRVSLGAMMGRNVPASLGVTERKRTKINNNPHNLIFIKILVDFSVSCFHPRTQCKHLRISPYSLIDRATAVREKFRY